VGFKEFLQSLPKSFLSLSYSLSIAILQRRSQTVDVAVAIAASVLRPDTQVNGRQAVGRRPPKDPQPNPSHPHLSGQLAQFPSIYLSSIHPCIHTDHFRHVRRQPKVRSSVVRLAKSLAYLCVCCVGWCVSVCLLVNLSFSFSFNFLLFFWAYHPLATHLPVSFVCGLPLCEITKGLLSRFLRLLTV